MGFRSRTLLFFLCIGLIAWFSFRFCSGAKETALFAQRGSLLPPELLAAVGRAATLGTVAWATTLSPVAWAATLGAAGFMDAEGLMAAAAFGVFGGFQITNFDVFLVCHIVC